MVVDTTKESVCINQLVGQKNETRVVEGDMIVPDIKPDILNTITTSGNVCIYKKEVLDGKVKIDGTVQVYIIYLADNQEGSIRGIHTSLDFTEMIPVENCKTGMNLGERAEVTSIETKVLNGRKVNIKANLGFSVKVYSNEEVKVIKEISGIDNVQKLNHEIEMNTLIGEGSTKAYAKETVSIDPIDNLAEILRADVKIQNKDTKVSYNKVLVKADAAVRILYLTEDNRMNSVESMIPLMGFVDIPNVSEEHLCDTDYELKNLLIKPNSEEEHSIYVEAEVEIACSTFEKRNMMVTEDLYSPTEKLDFTKKEIHTMSNKNTSRDVCSVKEKIAVPEMMGCKIHDISVRPSIATQTVTSGRVSQEGQVDLTILYWSENENRLEVKPVTLPFQFSMEVPNCEAGSNIDTEMEVEKQDFVLLPDGYLEARVDVGFSVKVANFRSVSVIDEITSEQREREDSYSMVIYFTKPGDTLWKIAKQFGSTVEDIARVNGIENPDVLPVGRQLFIPRFTVNRQTA